MESPIPDISPEDNLTTDQATVDPVLQEYQTEAKQEEWIKELQAARDERKAFDKGGVDTIRRYADQRGESENSIRYNLFYANTEIKTAALYSRTPEPSIRRRFLDARDDASRVASDLLQRVVSIEMDNNGFDQKFKQMLFDYLVPGIGIGWVRLEEEYSPAEVRIIEVLDPATGQMIQQEEQISPQLIEQNVPIDYVAWDDFLWAPCQVWTDCRWVARRVPMSKAAIEHRFSDTCPPEVLAEIGYEAKKAEKSTANPSDQLKPKHTTKATADVYEIWDKENKLICWIHEGSKVPLDVKQDTNEFPDFFPTPLPPLGRFTTASTIPRSDFSMVQDLYRMLDDLQAKAAGLVECIKVRFAYDATRPELSDIFSIGEGQGVPVKDWATWNAEKGGLANTMQFVPIQQFVEALALTVQQISAIKAEIFEIEGIADFMRGQTQAYDSAAAIEQKGTFASTRLGTQQKMVAKYIERLVRLVVHLISKFYKPEILVDHAGPIPTADMQYLPEAVKLLQTNFERNFRLMVSVDSIQDASWKIEQEERASVVRTIGGLVAQVGPMAASRPEIAPLVIELVRYAVAGSKGSNPIEGILDQGLQQILQTLSAGQQAPQPPSKEEIKAQVAAQKNETDLAITRMQEETKRAVAASEAESRRLNDLLEMRTTEIRSRIDAVEAQAKLIGAAHKQAAEVASLGGK